MAVQPPTIYRPPNFTFTSPRTRKEGVGGKINYDPRGLTIHKDPHHIPDKLDCRLLLELAIIW